MKKSRPEEKKIASHPLLCQTWARAAFKAQAQNGVNQEENREWSCRDKKE